MNEDYVCTSCGYKGKPKKWTKGSFAIEIVLWFFFLIPGLIYTIWRLCNKVEVCPSCRQATMIPSHSPIGQKLMHEFKHNETKINDYSDNVNMPAIKRHKSFKEAYSWGGLGLFDLIPEVRDLPYILRFILMVIVIAGLVWLIVPNIIDQT